MTSNLFGGTLNLAQSVPFYPTDNYHGSYAVCWRESEMYHTNTS